MQSPTALLAILLLAASFDVQAQESVLVPDGDVAALREAIEGANGLPDEPTEILLTGDFHFTDRLPMPEIAADITLRSFNQRARLLGPATGEEDAEHPRTLFRVGAGGSLSLRNLEIADISLALDDEGLIRNAGRLVIEQTVVSNVTGQGFCLNFGRCAIVQPIILNLAGGELVLDKVSFRESGGRHLTLTLGGAILSNAGQASLSAVQVYRTDTHSYWSTALVNEGVLEINSSSFFHATASAADRGSWLTAQNVADVTIRNSIVAGFGGLDCENATSRGHNLHDDADCGWASEGDLVGVPAGLMWRPVEAQWYEAVPQILDYALVPSAASAAADSANPETCSAFDLLGARRSRIDAHCDRGAVEARSAGLGEGGINGLYYNPQADGHYVQIMQTDFLTLVIWNTFDLEGNHVWVYGTGQLVDGQAVQAETWINRDVLVLPGQPDPDSGAEFWGTLEVEMTSCTSGNVAFDSVFPEFGSGQFPIERLAYVKQIGCVD